MANPVPLETQEELQFVKDYVMFPIILDVLERDIRMLQHASLKMPAVYIAMLRGLQDRAAADMVELRKTLRLHGMKVFDQRRTAAGVEASYLCRGYHRQFSLLWSVVKAEVEQKLRRYLGLE